MICSYCKQRVTSATVPLVPGMPWQCCVSCYFDGAIPEQTSNRANHPCKFRESHRVCVGTKSVFPFGHPRSNTTDPPTVSCPGRLHLSQQDERCGRRTLHNLLRGLSHRRKRAGCRATGHITALLSTTRYASTGLVGRRSCAYNPGRSPSTYGPQMQNRRVRLPSLRSRSSPWCWRVRQCCMAPLLQERLLRCQ